MAKLAKKTIVIPGYRVERPKANWFTEQVVYHTKVGKRTVSVTRHEVRVGR